MLKVKIWKFGNLKNESILKINKSTIQQINDKKSIFAQNQKTGI